MICRFGGCGEPLSDNNDSGYCRVHSCAARPLARAEARGDRDVVFVAHFPIGSNSATKGQAISLPRAPWSKEAGE